MGFPAARITDKTIHLGTIATGQINVLIGGKPAARVTDVHACAFHPPNVIAPPCAYNVLTGNRPQSRILDKCVCTAIIITGKWNVLVGTDGGSIMGMTITLLPNGDVQVGDHITINHDPNDPSYVGKILGDLAVIASRPQGQALINNINASGHNMSIHSFAPGASVNAYAQPGTGRLQDWQDATAAGQGVYNGRGQPINDAAGNQLIGTGRGVDGNVSYNPDDWPDNNPATSVSRTHPPGDVVLMHEMTHVEHDNNGTANMFPRADNFHTQEEWNTISDENTYRTQRDNFPTRRDHSDL
jgi:uncharacterized Zn-binding protein involved in type VI secretion